MIKNAYTSGSLLRCSSWRTDAVTRSSRTERCHASLRTLQSTLCLQHGTTHFTVTLPLCREDYGRGGKDEATTDSLSAIRGQSHSFSYAQLRARKDEREREREKLQPFNTAAAPQRPLYTSIDQFSQKVELYRGR
jgi:hypothetical protein